MKKKKNTIKEELSYLSNQFESMSDHLYYLQAEDEIPYKCKRRLSRKDIHTLKVRFGLMKRTLGLEKGKDL